MEIRFTIPGEPKGKARPRVTRTGHAYTPKETADYEELVKDVFFTTRGRCFFEQGRPLSIAIVAYFGIPKSATKKKAEAMRSGAIRPTKKPDLDNIVKIILDSCNKCAFYDDAQVVDMHISKYYSDTPRVEVRLFDAHIHSEWMERVG